MEGLIIKIWEWLTGKEEKLYEKYIENTFSKMRDMYSQIEEMLNNIDGILVDHTKVIYNMRVKIQADLICKLEVFKGAYYDKSPVMKEFSNASIEFLKTIDKMLGLPTAPFEEVTDNSFLTMLENRDYFVLYGDGKSSFMEKINMLIVYYRKEIILKWESVTQARRLLDDKLKK